MVNISPLHSRPGDVCRFLRFRADDCGAHNNRQSIRVNLFQCGGARCAIVSCRPPLCVCYRDDKARPKNLQICRSAPTLSLRKDCICLVRQSSQYYHSRDCKRSLQHIALY
jgi:hypothetical protein